MNQQSLDTALQINSDLWAINGPLTNDELTYLLSAIANETDWQKIEEQKNLNRMAMRWNPNGPCDWLWCKLNELDFSKFGLKFRTVSIWKDLPGYTIGDHFDNERVVAAMQIYLSADCDNIGTRFEQEIPFKQNTGYLMDNKNKLIHSMKHPVPDNYTRISFYALFDRDI